MSAVLSMVSQTVPSYVKHKKLVAWVQEIAAMWAIGLPSGPMENGTTYKVRPRMEPLNKPFKVARILAGSSQLLVGPASSFFSEQM